MNNKIIFVLGLMFCLLGNKVMAQDWSSPEVEQMYTQGLTTLSRGNTNEALAIFQKIAPLEPNNLAVKKSLAQAYLLSDNHKNALQILEPIVAAGNADPECYRLQALGYYGLKEDKKALKVLNDGLDKYANAGVLYYEQGLIFKDQKNYENALKCWVAGIAADPNYHLNYYEAAIAYVQSNEVIWAIIYAEIFINKEPYTQRSNETRTLLLDAYHKLFFTPSKNANGDLSALSQPNNFIEAVKKTYLSLFFVVSDGITTENLTMLRSRFMVSWSDNYKQKYPFTLFDAFDNMMRNGQFDVYHQWLVGKTENPQEYTKWTSTFGKEFANFEQYRTKNPIVLQSADAYNQQKNFKGLFPENISKASKR